VPGAATAAHHENLERRSTPSNSCASGSFGAVAVVIVGSLHGAGTDSLGDRPGGVLQALLTWLMKDDAGDMSRADDWRRRGGSFSWRPTAGNVSSVEVFHVETGDRGAPVAVLIHGWPMLAMPIAAA
jgi:hypothetical protein